MWVGILLKNIVSCTMWSYQHTGVHLEMPPYDCDQRREGMLLQRMHPVGCHSIPLQPGQIAIPDKMTPSRGCYGWVLARARRWKILYFLGGSARRRKCDTHPTNAIVCAGRVGRGLTKGGGSLVGADDSHKVSQWWEFYHGGEGGNGCAGRFLWVKPTLGIDLGDVAAGTTHANVPLRRQSWERATWMSRNIDLGVNFRLMRWDRKSAIWGGGGRETRVSVVRSSFCFFYCCVLLWVFLILWREILECSPYRCSCVGAIFIVVYVRRRGGCWVGASPSVPFFLIFVGGDHQN